MNVLYDKYYYIFYEFVMNIYIMFYQCEYIFEYYLINRMIIKLLNLLSEVEILIVVLGFLIFVIIVVIFDVFLRIWWFDSYFIYQIIFEYVFIFVECCMSIYYKFIKDMIIFIM